MTKINSSSKKCDHGDNSKCETECLISFSTVEEREDEGESEE